MSKFLVSKLFAIMVSLKATFIAANIGFTRGETLPVILISVLFNLAQLGAKKAASTVRAKIPSVPEGPSISSKNSKVFRWKTGLFLPDKSATSQRR